MREAVWRGFPEFPLGRRRLCVAGQRPRKLDIIMDMVHIGPEVLGYRGRRRITREDADSLKALLEFRVFRGPR